MLAAIPVLIAYLIGAIPFALIIARLAGIGDLRKIGSGNLGATNVWRAAGFKAAIWVFIGDIGKGIIAVLLAGYFASNFEIAFISRDVLLVVCALAAVVGHIFPVYIGGRGGKGVNTAVGAVGTLLPVEVLLGVLVFAGVFALSRYVSLGSIIGAITLFAAVAVEKYLLNIIIADIYFYLTAVLALLIVVTHYQNIGRLIAGTENRFSFSKSERANAND